MWSGIIGGVATLAASSMAQDSAGDAANAQREATGAAATQTKEQMRQTREDLSPYRSAGERALSRLNYQMGLTPYDKFSVNDAYRAQANANGASLADNWMGDDVTLENFVKSHPELIGSDAGSLSRKFSLADLNSDPVYNTSLQFGLDEGTKAIERRAAASGGLDSGATLKGLARFATDYGGTKATDAYNRFEGEKTSNYNRLSGISGMGLNASTATAGNSLAGSNNLSGLYTGLGNAQGASILSGANSLSSGVTNAVNSYNSNRLLDQLSGGGSRMSGYDTGMSDISSALARS